MTDQSIPSEVLELARRRIEIEFAERTEQTARDAAQILETAGRRGTVFSSGTVVLTRRLLEREYNVRAHIAWQVLARALTARGAPIKDGLSAALKKELGTLLAQGCQDLRDCYQKTLSMTQGMGSFSLSEMDDAQKKALERIASEIDFAVLEASRSSDVTSPGSAQTFNIANVGAIQTGPGATATVHMGLDDVAKEALVEALQTVSTALAESREIPREVYVELTEVVAEAQSEIGKSKPNVTKLRGAVSALGNTVRTVGSLPGAYDALKTAGSLIGVALP